VRAFADEAQAGAFLSAFSARFCVPVQHESIYGRNVTANATASFSIITPDSRRQERARSVGIAATFQP